MSKNLAKIYEWGLEGEDQNPITGSVFLSRKVRESVHLGEDGNSIICVHCGEIIGKVSTYDLNTASMHYERCAIRQVKRALE